MSEEMQGNKGFCAYCGQAVFIQTVGEVGQDELDRMATDKCMCPQAQSERRKKGNVNFNVFTKFCKIILTDMKEVHKWIKEH